jgi:hypothetical protein
MHPSHPSLVQEVGWFDRDRNSSGALTSKLSADALAVKGQFGDTLGLITQNAVTISESPQRGWGPSPMSEGVLEASLICCCAAFSRHCNRAGFCRLHATTAGMLPQQACTCDVPLPTTHMLSHYPPAPVLFSRRLHHRLCEQLADDPSGDWRGASARCGGSHPDPPHPHGSQHRGHRFCRGQPDRIGVVQQHAHHRRFRAGGRGELVWVGMSAC